MTVVPETFATHSIGALSARFGVSLRTLRFYEERGLRQPVHYRGRRYYSGKDVVRLQIVLLAKRFGSTIHEIWDLIESRAPSDEAPNRVFDLGLSRREIGTRIERLMRRRREIDVAIAELGAAMPATAEAYAS